MQHWTQLLIANCDSSDSDVWTLFYCFLCAYVLMSVVIQPSWLPNPIKVILYMYYIILARTDLSYKKDVSTFTRSKVIWRESQKSRSFDLGHASLGSLIIRCIVLETADLSNKKTKCLALFKSYRGSQNLKCKSHDPDHVPVGVSHHPLYRPILLAVAYI